MCGCDLDEVWGKVVGKFEGEEFECQVWYCVFIGNCLLIILVYLMFDFFMFGQIIVLYEYCVFVEGVVLGVNFYDQWGVEFGKELVMALQLIVEGKESVDSKDGLIVGFVSFLQVNGL